MYQNIWNDRFKIIKWSNSLLSIVSKWNDKKITIVIYSEVIEYPDEIENDIKIKNDWHNESKREWNAPILLGRT